MPLTLVLELRHSINQPRMLMLASSSSHSQGRPAMEMTPSQVTITTTTTVEATTEVLAPAVEQMLEPGTVATSLPSTSEQPALAAKAAALPPL